MKMDDQIKGVKRVLFLTGLFFSALLFLIYLPSSAQLTTEEKEAKGQEPKEDALAAENVEKGFHFASVGVLPFSDDTKVMHGGKRATRIFFERLQRKFPKTAFKLLELPEEEYSGGPLLLKQAQRIGEKYGVEALMEGYLIGYKITGGIWPSKAVSQPEVQAVLQLRIVETKGGTIAGRYEYAPKKPKIYPQRIRTEEELFGRVMRDIVDELSKQMDDDDLFLEEEEGKE